MLSQVDLTNMAGFGDVSKDLLKASGALLLASPGLAAGGVSLTKFGSGAKKTGEGLSAITAGITDVVSSVKTVPADVTGAGDAIIMAMERIITAITSSLAKTKSDTASEIEGILDTTVKAINDKKPDYITSGVNLVTGFISGIQSRSSAAASAAAEMAASALRAVNSTLQINSPSKAFALVGMYSDMGLAKGLKDYSYLAANAAEKVGTNTISRVVDAGNKALKTNTLMTDGLQRAAQTAISITPTITSSKTVTMNHTFEPLHVEGVNNEGEFVAAADYSVEEMFTSLIRRQSRV